MGCCGDKTGKVRKLAEIGASYVRLGTDALRITKPYKHTEERLDICRGCDDSTWMSLREYEAYLVANGITEIIENIDCLEKLPSPPKNPYSKKRRRLVCMLCKCLLRVKAGRGKNRCNAGKWDKLSE